VADPDALRPDALAQRRGAVRRRRGGRRRSDDGEGIAQALETGELAAEAIAAGGEPDAVSARYRRRVRRALGRDLRFASALQAVLRSPSAHAAAIAAAGLTPWTRPQLRPLDVRGLSARADLTPDRWRRGAFSTPGAYSVP
jgi:flavin-dependent dehydrogenase